jgi:hypothetical protein
MVKGQNNLIFAIVLQFSVCIVVIYGYVHWSDLGLIYANLGHMDK